MLKSRDVTSSRRALSTSRAVTASFTRRLLALLDALRIYVLVDDDDGPRAVRICAIVCNVDRQAALRMARDCGFEIVEIWSDQPLARASGGSAGSGWRSSPT